MWIELTEQGGGEIYVNMGTVATIARNDHAKVTFLFTNAVEKPRIVVEETVDAIMNLVIEEQARIAALPNR